MTDQMHDGKCNELLVREETIHGRGPAEAAYNPNLLPSLRFLRLVIFFTLLLAVARAAVPYAPPLPELPSQRLTDRQELATCVGRFDPGKKLMCCINAKMCLSWGDEEGMWGKSMRTWVSAWWLLYTIHYLLNSCTYHFRFFLVSLNQNHKNIQPLLIGLVIFHTNPGNMQ